MRSYKQYCGVAKALDHLGSRWTLLLVRDLLPGPRRFSDLLVPGLTPTVLTQRLHHLRDLGLAEQVRLPPPAARKVWRLTDEGQALEPILLALGAYGARHLDPETPAERRLRWLMVSLRRRYRGNWAGVVHVRAPDEPYTLHADGTRLETTDGLHRTPDTVLAGPRDAIAALLAHGRFLPSLTVDGDAAVVHGLLASLDPVRPVE